MPDLEGSTTMGERVYIRARPETGDPFDNAFVAISVIPTGLLVVHSGPLVVILFVGRIDDEDQRHARDGDAIRLIDPYDSWERSRREKCFYDVWVHREPITWQYLNVQYYSGVLDRKKGVSLSFVNDKGLAGESSLAIDHWLRRGGEGLFIPG